MCECEMALTVKWFDSTWMSYGFIIMGNKVVSFHVNNARSGEDHTQKPGDEVTFIYDDYEKGAIDVQFLPTLSDFPSTSEDKSSFARRQLLFIRKLTLQASSRRTEFFLFVMSDLPLPQSLIIFDRYFCGLD